jgi:hypothetical protein
MQRLTRVPDNYPTNPYPSGKLPPALKRTVVFGGIGSDEPAPAAPKKRATKKRKRKPWWQEC